MKRLLTMELNKAYRNPWFVVSAAIACSLAVASAVGNIYYYQDYGVFELYTHKYVSPVPGSCYKWWISLDFAQPTSSLLFQLLPLLVVIPYAWSWRSELCHGYLNQVATRSTQANYLFAKGAINFSVGFVLGFFPLLLNFILLACFIPAYMPDITELLYLGVYPGDQLSWLFYNCPVLYVLSFSLLAGIICGLWASFVHSLSFLIENRVALLIAPYLGTLALQFLSDRIYLVLGSINGPQLGLAANMRAGVENYSQPLWFIALECALLFALSLLLTRHQKRRDIL